jgi:hypothetical protein
MAYHVMVLTRQDVNEGKLRIPEMLGEEAVRRMAIPRQAQAGAMHRGRMEVLALDPLHERFHELRRNYGEDTQHVLFFNDDAEQACDMFGIEVQFAAVIRDDQLPENLGVALQLDHFYVAAV